MAPPTKSPAAGGSLIALCLIVGAILGAAAGQPSLGVVIGMLVGAAIATIIWLRDRR